MKEIEQFETKIKNIRELTIDTIEHDYEKLINDLDIDIYWFRYLDIEKGLKNRNKTREIKTIKNNSWYD